VKSSGGLETHQKTILGAALLSLALWAIPGVHFLMLPLQYLNTHIHELCHALTAMATGGTVLGIVVRPNGSGETPIMGGSLFFEVSAGYIGAAMVGALIILLGHREQLAKNTLRVVAVVLVLSVLGFVLRGGDFAVDAFGAVTGVLWAIILWFVSVYLKGSKLLFATQFIGVQQCLNAVQSLYVLIQLSAFGETHSDAQIMAENTHIPAIVWAAGWSAFSLLIVGLALRRSWKKEQPSSPRPGSSSV